MNIDKERENVARIEMDLEEQADRLEGIEAELAGLPNHSHQRRLELETTRAVIQVHCERCRRALANLLEKIDQENQRRAAAQKKEDRALARRDKYVATMSKFARITEIQKLLGSLAEMPEPPEADKRFTLMEELVRLSPPSVDRVTETDERSLQESILQSLGASDDEIRRLRTIAGGQLADPHGVPRRFKVTRTEYIDSKRIPRKVRGEIEVYPDGSCDIQAEVKPPQDNEADFVFHRSLLAQAIDEPRRNDRFNPDSESGRETLRVHAAELLNLARLAVSGDHRFFKRVSDILKSDPGIGIHYPSPRKDGQRWDLQDAVKLAVRRLWEDRPDQRRFPTQEEVREALRSVGRGPGQPLSPPVDDIKGMLEDIGLGWLPYRGKGDNLKRGFTPDSRPRVRRL